MATSLAALTLVAAFAGATLPALPPTAARLLAAGLARRDAPYDSLDEFRLQNGVRVVLCHVPMAPVTVMSSYHVGSAQDPEGRSGLAHVASHLGFRAAESLPPAGRDTALSRAHSLENSRGVDWEWTEFWTTLPGAGLEVGVALEAYRLAALARPLSSRVFEEERDVVIRERKHGFDGVLADALNEETLAALFPPGHPYNRPTTGTLEDLRRLSVDDALAFVRTWFRAPNLTLTIVGNFVPRDARALVERSFKDFPGGAPPPREAVPELNQATIRGPLISMAQGPATRVDAAWLVPSLFDVGDAEAALAAWVLTARLARRRSAERLTGTIMHMALPGQGVLLATISGPAGVDPAKLLEWLDGAVSDLADNPPPVPELRRALGQVEANFAVSFDGQAGQAEWGRILRDYSSNFGRVDRLAWDLQRYRSVIPEDVSRFATETLTSGNRSVVFAPAESGTR